MSDFDLARARRSLDELAKEFRRGTGLYPDLRHRLVEAPAERIPEIADQPPSCWSSASRHDARIYFDDTPPARCHIYFGVDECHDGADLEMFRILASRASDIIDECPRSAPGFCLVSEPNIEFRKRDRSPEAWMVVVHRLAWRNIPAQPLKATPSTPAIKGERNGFKDMGIPNDCISSNLPEASAFQASAWAIDLLIEEMGKTPPPKVVVRDMYESNLIGVLEEFIRHDREHRSCVARKLPGYQRIAGEVEYLGMLIGIEECIVRLRNGPHPRRLQWLWQASHAADEFHAAYERFKVENPDENIRPAWVPEARFIASFDVVRRKLIGEPLDVGGIDSPAEPSIGSTAAEATKALIESGHAAELPGDLQQAIDADPGIDKNSGEIKESSKSGYLELFFREDRMVVERMGSANKAKLRSNLHKHLFCLLFQNRESYSSRDRLKLAWERADLESPDDPRVDNELTMLRKTLAPLGIKVVALKNTGWRLESKSEGDKDSG